MHFQNYDKYIVGLGATPLGAPTLLMRDWKRDMAAELRCTSNISPMLPPSFVPHDVSSVISRTCAHMPPACHCPAAKAASSETIQLKFPRLWHPRNAGRHKFMRFDLNWESRDCCDCPEYASE